jgi:DNA mismatch endonuclease (patch repair protein)
MRAVRTKNTAPELLVKRLVRKLGYSFRIHSKKLAGKPDLVFRSRRAVIFVHGCFWHSHHCRRGTIPRSNKPFWKKKLSGNVARDAAIIRSLRRGGWRSLVVWECQLKNIDRLETRIERFLGRSLS